jgi:ureidoglycolate hydrolase
MVDAVNRIAVTATPFSGEAWAPFGWLPADELDPADDTHIEFEWADPHLNIIGHEHDEIEWTERGGAVCDHLNRHLTHTQALMPLNQDALVTVAPPGTAFDDPATVDAVRVFVVPKHACVILRRGTWHWGPYPLGPGRLQLLNFQGKRYVEDNGVADLQAIGVEVEAIPAGAAEEGH